jgi:hypothetical protein
MPGRLALHRAHRRLTVGSQAAAAMIAERQNDAKIGGQVTAYMVGHYFRPKR